MVFNGEILDQVTQEFLKAMVADGHAIQNAAKQIFYYLALIQLALTALWMTIAGESMQRFFTRIVQLSFALGFFYGLMQFGGEWLPDIINGFVELGQKGGVNRLIQAPSLIKVPAFQGPFLKLFLDGD